MIYEVIFNVGGDENAVGLDNLDRVRLVDFIVVPHYAPAQKKVVEENIAKDKIIHSILTLTDKQAILINGKKIQFIGPGEFKQFK
ncbi:MAG: hypothetical protein V1705_00205 [bacterium]